MVLLAMKHVWLPLSVAVHTVVLSMAVTCANCHVKMLLHAATCLLSDIHWSGASIQVRRIAACRNRCQMAEVQDQQDTAHCCLALPGGVSLHYAGC